MSSQPSTPANNLSLETSAAVASMMQYLVHKSETGLEPSEHELAAPRAAAYSNDDKKPDLDDLMKILSGTTDTPGQQVSNGTPPIVPVITVIPERQYMQGDIQKNYRSLMDSQSLCQLYASIFQLKEKPDGWNITQAGQAAIAFKAQAEYAWNAMTNSLAGFFNFSQGTEMIYEQTLDKSSIHDGFLGKIFGGFGFDKDTMQQLDGILTGFTSSLGSVPMGDGGTKTIDHVVRLNLVPRINVSGDDEHPDYVYQPTTSVIYLKIDSNSYQKSVSKNNMVEKVEFRMTFTVFKFQLNADLFEKNRPKFDKVFEMLTKKSMSAFTDRFVKKVESKSVNPQ